MNDDLRQAASVIATYIEQGPDLQKRRWRYSRYAALAGHPVKLTRWMQGIVGKMVLEGIPLADVRIKPALVEALSSKKSATADSGWRLRAALFFEVGNEMDRRHIVIGPVSPAEDDELTTDFGPEPEDSEFDYA
ncbi:hypothetical protein ABZ897_54005 [Nonomuraea sp. NPDC046802]|uniref:hypothetical protein n=1 Tax=Nonomuraea sp. NPDC046802 TaxID=3154919 RepID=UPI0033DC0596